MNWQPIETAPQDGTAILVARASAYKKAEYQTVAEFRDDNWWASVNPCCGPVDEPLFCDVGSPTHWMPLPPPP